MPLAPKLQNPHKNLHKLLQFRAKTAIMSSVMVRQSRSFSLVRFLHFKEIRINASLPMLTDLWSHFSASFVTVSKRENNLGMSDVSSDLAFNDRQCRLWPSIISHRRHTRAYRFRSPEDNDWKMQAKHLSGSFNV
ncbi:Uncharacterized protein Fot_25033 [Forsythia ovata]|uniref:Uncharacterized protein n=1 Tax=Forsythia ovata TaxID=205694 RepID=A0ABD1U7Z2_9LAMI